MKTMKVIMAAMLISILFVGTALAEQKKISSEKQSPMAAKWETIQL